MNAIEAMLQQPAAQAVGWALIQFIWQGAVIGVATAAVLAALRRSAADIRYVVSTIALSLMLTLPIVTTFQSLSIDRPRADAFAERTVPRETIHAAKPSSVPPVERERATFSTPRSDAPDDPLQPWLPALFGIWLTGVCMLTVRLLSGWLWVQRLKSHGAHPAAAFVDALATRLTRQLHITRHIRLLESSIVDVPTVIGWLKPVVLLPASALAGLTPQQLEAVVAHELAHVRRHDYLVNLLQIVVETLLFYHPSVWWLSRRIRIERENCCDDLAVSLCGDPLTYASALAEMEGMRGSRPHFALAASGGSLLQRVRRLLGAPSHVRRAPGWLAAGLAILVIVAIAASTLGPDAVVAESAIESDVALIYDAEGTSPAPPVPPAPPAPPASALMLEDTRVESGHRVQAIAGPRMSRAMARERATRRCIERIRQELPVQLRGSAHALRGACQALLRMRDTVADGRQVAKREVAAIRPVVAEAVTEPIEQVASAIAEASRVTAAQVEPVLAEVARAIEQAGKRRLSSRGQGSSGSRRSTGNYVWSNNGEKVEVNYQGDIDFTDDDTDVRAITPGGWLRIKRTERFGSDRTVEFRADKDGKIHRRFWSGRSERPFDPDGRTWASEMLPRFIRQSGIGAARRVARIHRSKGTAGVFAEIALVEGSWAKRVYYSELLKLTPISARDVQQALSQAGTEIDSDFELASLLISADHLVKDDATRKAYLEAARTIGSDFEMRRVFSAALEGGLIAPALLSGLLDASASIESDFEAASLLVQIAEGQGVDATTRTVFFRALETVGSSFEHRRVLAALLKRSNLSIDVQVGALESAASIGSDFECASVLLEFAKDQSVEGAVRAPFFKAVSTINSAFERGRVLQAVAKRSDASNETVLNVIRSAQGMNGSFEQAQVLLAVAASQELTREGRDAYIDASERLGSYEQGRVLAALVKNDRRR